MCVSELMLLLINVIIVASEHTKVDRPGLTYPGMLRSRLADTNVCGELTQGGAAVSATCEQTERQVLEAIAAAGSGWPASWAAGTAEGPCGAGWNSETEGWVGVRCGAAGGSVSRIMATDAGGNVLMPDYRLITGDVSSLSQLAQITLM